MWVGYDIDGVSDDLEHLGLIRVDDWTEEELAERGVRSFMAVDDELKKKLGLANPERSE